MKVNDILTNSCKLTSPHGSFSQRFTSVINQAVNNSYQVINRYRMAVGNRALVRKSVVHCFPSAILPSPTFHAAIHPYFTITHVVHSIVVPPEGRTEEPFSRYLTE